MAEQNPTHEFPHRHSAENLSQAGAQAGAADLVPLDAALPDQ